jgi:ribosomal protein S18 acetylase RimI-like enzyme
LNLTIREAGPADWRFIEALGKRTAMDSVSTLRRAGTNDVVESLERLLEVVVARRHLALIAEIDGRAVGFLVALDSLPDEVTGEDQAFIAYMAVEPAVRGGGIGSALLERAEDEARRRGAPYMALMVTEENAAARALYEKSGYAVERRLLCKAL